MQISDGTSNTVMLGEAEFELSDARGCDICDRFLYFHPNADSDGGSDFSEALGSTRYRINNKAVSNNERECAFASQHSGGINVGLGDGSIRFVRDSINLTDLAAARLPQRWGSDWRLLAGGRPPCTACRLSLRHATLFFREREPAFGMVSCGRSARELSPGGGLAPPPPFLRSSMRTRLFNLVAHRPRPVPDRRLWLRRVRRGPHARLPGEGQRDGRRQAGREGPGDLPPRPDADPKAPRPTGEVATTARSPSAPTARATAPGRRVRRHRHLARVGLGHRRRRRLRRRPARRPLRQPEDVRPAGERRRGPDRPPPVQAQVSRGGPTCRPVRAPRPAGVHADRAAGRDRHHRHPDRPAAPRRPEGPRGRRPHAVHEQPEAARPGPAQLPRHATATSRRPATSTPFNPGWAPTHGWGTFLLPYIEQDNLANLYRWTQLVRPGEPAGGRPDPEDVHVPVRPRRPDGPGHALVTSRAGPWTAAVTDYTPRHPDRPGGHRPRATSPTPSRGISTA